MNRYQRSFIGKIFGIFFDSGGPDQEGVNLTIFRKPKKNAVEIPSESMGLTIEMSLRECVMIQGVLIGKFPQWSTVHKEGEYEIKFSICRTKTDSDEISFEIDDGKLKYFDKISPPEAKYWLLLLTHVIEDKIANVRITKGFLYEEGTYPMMDRNRFLKIRRKQQQKLDFNTNGGI